MATYPSSHLKKMHLYRPFLPSLSLVCRRLRPPLPVRAPRGYSSLIRACGRADPAARPDFTALVASLEQAVAAHRVATEAHRTAVATREAAVAATGYAAGGGGLIPPPLPPAPASFPCGIADFVNKDEGTGRPM